MSTLPILFGSIIIVSLCFITINERNDFVKWFILAVASIQIIFVLDLTFKMKDENKRIEQILKECPGKTDEYHLNGECYFHGFDDGFDDGFNLAHDLLRLSKH